MVTPKPTINLSTQPSQPDTHPPPNPSLPPIKLQKLSLLSDILPNLSTFPTPLDTNPSYCPSDGFYIWPTDVVLRHIVFDLATPSSTDHILSYHRAGPRRKIFFNTSTVRAAIVTYGGLCPGLNTVIRELVVGQWDLYGVRHIFGIMAGFRGLYSSEPLALDPKMVHNWHHA